MGVKVDEKALTKIRDDLIESKRKETRENLNFYAVLLLLLFFIVLIVHLNYFVLMNIEVSGSSMETTLESGDNLISIRGAKIERGDIIIINKNTHKTEEIGDYYIIKRVIGVGGDTVEIKPDGKVYLNGDMLEENYLDDHQITKVYDFIHGKYEPGYFKIVLEEDEIFYLGDNRLNSLDARVNGPCKKSDVISVVSDFTVKHRKGFTAFFKFMRGISDRLTFGCGSKE